MKPDFLVDRFARKCRMVRVNGQAGPVKYNEAEKDGIKKGYSKTYCLLYLFL